MAYVRIFTANKFYGSKLLVCTHQNSNFPFVGQQSFDPFDMDLRIFPAVTMSDVNGKLKHNESITHDFFSKSGMILPILLCFGRKIKKYKNPQNSILI